MRKKQEELRMTRPMWNSEGHTVLTLPLHCGRGFVLRFVKSLRRL